MTIALYELDTREDDDGIERPNEVLWAPAGKDALDNGFINIDGLHLCGVGPEDEPPTEFIALGHGHTWTALCAAADRWMRHWAPAYTADETVRQPLPEPRHAVFIRHPHPAHPCGCAWDGQWRIVYAPAEEPGAIAVTYMRARGWTS